MPLYNPTIPRHYWDLRYGIHLEDDFAGNIGGVFQVTTSGGTVQVQSQGTALPAGWIGSVRFLTNTVATGAAVLSAYNPIPLGLGATWHEALWRIPVLSTGVETFTVRCGYIDIGTAESTDAVAFRYTDAVNGGRFEAYARNNSVETAVDTGVTVAINTDYKMRVEVNAAASRALFYINNSLVATITTNIPSGQTRFTGAGLNLLKSAGTTNRDLYADFMKFDYVFTTPRS